MWRFSYLAAENGGAAFVVLYLVATLVIGLPVLLAELVLGRGAQKSPQADEAHCRAGARIQETVVSEFDVPARTLTSVLDEAAAGRVDFLSLDVEGYELQALNGLDIERFRPRHILVEARFREEVERRLSPYYDALDELTHHDVLYRWKDR